ncbi:ATP-dependent endonuclease [Nocardia fluminea]|uniref:ATP-dependent nuclease n=1 Tax=Nocardia fluminea TaxID=134984 RepID=UPI00366BCB6E
MTFSHLEIHGLRGFATKQTLKFSSPSGQTGSGLTIIVGPNSNGKSTIVDSIRMLLSRDIPSINESERNSRSADRVEISLFDESKLYAGFAMDANNPSAGDRTRHGTNFFVVPSRRAFDAFLAHGVQNTWMREQYTTAHNQSGRPETDIYFASRLNVAWADPEKRKKFQGLLGRIVDNPPEWVIDRSAQGTPYVKIKGEGFSYNSNGLGEGLISLLFIVDSLYDSQPGELIVIDEPELSLHPQQQRRLRRVLSEFARDRQICFATHSPYFISWEDISAGATIARVVKDEQGDGHIRQADRLTLNSLVKLAENRYNPHILGTDANEVFFLADSVVITEGQEDVVYFKLLSQRLGFDHSWSFFGWGAGGASNVEKIVQLLQELGYRRVVGVLDNDMRHIAERLQVDYSGYLFVAIPADDIRTKVERTTDYKKGLFDENTEIRSEFVEGAKVLLEKVDAYLSLDSGPS